MTKIFFTGSNGLIGSKIKSLLESDTNCEIIKMKFRFDDKPNKIKKFFMRHFLDGNNDNNFLIHFGYNWMDKNETNLNSNFNGSIKLFKVFLSVFPKSKIIHPSTTVATLSNKSSYSQVKLNLEKWVHANNHYNLICGIFVDYPCFGQAEFLKKISLSPIIFLPCKIN